VVMFRASLVRHVLFRLEHGRSPLPQGPGGGLVVDAEIVALNRLSSIMHNRGTVFAGVPIPTG
jgi:hypothetical protein